MEVKGILCDLDGTLIDTQKANLNAYNYALSEFGLKFKADEFDSTVGYNSRFFLKEMFPILSLTDIERVREIKTLVYPEYFFDTKLNIKLLNFLENLNSIQVLGIVTSGKKSSTLKILDFHGIRGKFKTIITGDDVEFAKPHPEPYRQALSSANLPAGQVLAFEDSDVGCLSATSAGINVVRISKW